MVLSKLNKLIFVVSIVFTVQCYQDPFFELTVRFINQELNSVPNTLVTVEVTDLDSGNPINGSIIYFESTTNNQGESYFSFDNKAFITVRVCAENNFCGDGHIYLEENENKELTLMIEDGECLYCF